MRIINSKEIEDTVSKMCIEANCRLPDDVLLKLREGRAKEESPIGCDILDCILENADIAKSNNMPICQDTGMAVFFIELGQEVMIEGDILSDAVNNGVRRGYSEGYLRKSVVSDPLRRVNTKDNTPAVIYLSQVKGDKIKITLSPKGFGSENMGGVKMLKPSDGEDGVKKFIIDTVSAAGPNPCPPIVVGVGIGGTMDMAAVLSKRALTLPLTQDNPDPYYADMERRLLEKINSLGIGPQGLGGRITALKVNILTYPTHIAGLPVAVNISCHVTRHLTAEI